jgi:type VI secretion system protein ImpC
VASQAGGPFLAGAEPAIAGTTSFADHPDPTDWAIPEPSPWLALRKSPLAAWVGLAAPRILLRVPYGRGREETEDFAFEELSSPPVHEELLWGSAGFAAASLLARSFAESGEDMEPGDVLDLDDRPACAVGRGDEQRLVPAAEAFLSERAADAMLGRGLMPLLSWRDRNAARLVRFQSLALPPAPLRGRWE